MAMPDDATVALSGLIERRDFSGLIIYCEASLLKAASRAGLTHEYYSVHVLSLVCLGRLVSARHLWRQRALLAPQPVPPKDAAATAVAQAAWARDTPRALQLLSEVGDDVLLAPLARAACVILRERCVQQLARAYVRISGSVLAAKLGIPESDLPKLANLGWTQDSDGYLCPPSQKQSSDASKVIPAIPSPSDQVSMLADQLIRLQTTG